MIAAGLWELQTKAWGEGSTGSCSAAPGCCSGLETPHRSSCGFPCWQVTWRGLSPLGPAGQGLAAHRMG